MEVPVQFAIYPEQELRKKVHKAAFDVHNTVGARFLERVYSNALSLESKQMGLACDQEVIPKVKYREVVVGDYFADSVVERGDLIELKACASLESVHVAQILNYLNASGIRVELLLNFGRPRLEYRRFGL